jgi:hypothetical protein
MVSDRTVTGALVCLRMRIAARLKSPPLECPTKSTSVTPYSSWR